MARRTIQSPGVEINEIDLSLRPADKIGTNIFITGFAPKGPNDEILQISSLSEFEQIYGLPTNAAERYFYHTVAQSFNSRANILVNRLPYGPGTGTGFTSKYFATVYPAIPINQTVYNNISSQQWPYGTGYQYLTANIDEAGGQVNSQFSPASSGNTVMYFLGKPAFVPLTHEQYTAILDDSAISWSNSVEANSDNFKVDSAQTSVGDQLASLSKAGVILLNTAKTTVNQKFEGYYASLVDNTNLYASTDYDDITRFQVSKNESDDIENITYGELVEIPSTRLNFELSASYNSDAIPANISETQESIASFNINNNNFDDTLVLGIYKLRQSVFSPEVTKLDYVLEEGYIGSIDYYRQIGSPNGGQPQSFYLPQITVNNSVNVAMKINPNISGRFAGATLTDNAEPLRKVRVVTDQLINNVYSGEDAAQQYTQIVGIAKEDVQGIDNGSAIKNTSSTPYGVSNYGQGNASALPFAPYSTTKIEFNNIGDINSKLDRVFDRLANVDLFDIDIVPEGGLATIATTITYSTNPANTAANYFDDRDSLKGLNELSATGINIAQNGLNIRSTWMSTQNKFIRFAQNVRKDFIYISDPIRQILITGDNTKGINIPGQNFPLNILTPLKQIYTNVNNSYTAAYATYGQVRDSNYGGLVWIPFSGVAAGTYARTDANFAPWYAPAGFTRGLVGSLVTDIALYPNQKQRDALYEQVNINPVALFPSEGFVIFGQKTMQSQPSALDRVNVRRLFLYLEKRTRETVKYFVFEPNTLFTRTNVINVLTPIFEDAKNNEGLYDYLIVCDERNNTPDVIDANELIVDIYLKPVRAAEFILVNFYATRTGTDFSEIVG